MTTDIARSAEAAATVTAPPPPHAGVVHLGRHPFIALLARDLRVLRRELGSFVLRAATQPVLFAFVFAYVLPKTQGSAGASSHPGGTTFATILVPGLVASAVMMQGIMAVAMPLVMELSYTREIEDRVLAPVPLWMLGVAKIVSGALQGTVAALVVFPCVMFIHAPGQAPHISLARWPAALGVLVLAAVLFAGIGLLFGTLVEPRKLGLLMTVLMLPITMLGCVYYPWATLGRLGWLQDAVLVNPLVYVSEGLRATMVPAVPHVPTWAFMAVLTAGSVVVCGAATQTLRRRITG